MKDWFEKQCAKVKDKATASKIVICLGIVGMVLILFSELIGGQEKELIDPSPIQVQSTKQITTDATLNEESYRTKLEESLAVFIGQLDGAGRTVVMITLLSGQEAVYAQDVSESETLKTENHIILETGSALTQTVLSPTVCGVVVLCEGGDQIVIVAKITEMLTALFDISSNHISVEKLA